MSGKNIEIKISATGGAQAAGEIQKLGTATATTAAAPAVAAVEPIAGLGGKRFRISGTNVKESDFQSLDQRVIL